MTQMSLVEYEMRAKAQEVARPEPTGQCDRLLRYLLSGKSITPLESWQELGIYRLSARIWDLKRMGCDIRQELVEVKSAWGDTARVAKYSMGGK
jgi:hypothetical protein